jgi:uncharacterized repeat protein (TIGR03806 family)
MPAARPRRPRRPWPVPVLAWAACACGGSDGPRCLTQNADLGLDQRPANASCTAPARPPQDAEIALEPVFADLIFDRPVLLLQVPGRDERFYVVEQIGRIQLVQNGVKSLFVDISGRVTSGNYGDERGLLGAAFDPRFADNGRVYLSYNTTENGALLSIISRFRSGDGGATLDAGSEQRLLRVEQPFPNHNGGGIAFGPDGYLYIGLGDGGSGGDPMGNGQNPGTLLGKFLRIDVATSDETYNVPADNPFPDPPYRKEIWALGFRNPWRWSFDRATGALWAGDVGQNVWEEVDLVRKGGNYGWDIREGAHCFETQSCATAGLVEPVVEYDHSLGVSITGGHVYRGSAIPTLVGRYVYGDFASGRIWGVFSDADGNPEARQLLSADKRISSFGEGNDGELYVLHYGDGGDGDGKNDGQLYKIVPAGPPPPDTFPRKLSQTGCMQPERPWRPGPGLVPYTVNAQLWSDGAAKERWFAIPDGTRIGVAQDGDLDFPVGTVVVKQFRLGERPIETRLLIRHDDGEWGGYSYEWDPDGDDATLLPASKTVSFGSQRWFYPGREDCMRCHTGAAGRSLGLEVAQLGGLHDYGNGRVAPQLATLAHIDLFDGALPAVPPLPGSCDGADREREARAVLHANCSHCHRPGGGGRGELDLRFTTPLAMAGICNVSPQHGTLGLSEPRLLTPGQPERSLIAARMRALDVNRMPPLATSVVDAASVRIVEDWIRALPDCP